MKKSLTLGIAIVCALVCSAIMVEYPATKDAEPVADAAPVVAYAPTVDIAGVTGLPAEPADTVAAADRLCLSHRPGHSSGYQRPPQAMERSAMRVRQYVSASVIGTLAQALAVDLGAST